MSVMPLNHVGTFQLKNRGDETVEVSKAANFIRNSNLKKKTKNGSTEVPDAAWSYPARSCFKGTQFHVTS